MRQSWLRPPHAPQIESGCERVRILRATRLWKETYVARRRVPVVAQVEVEVRVQHKQAILTLAPRHAQANYKHAPPDGRVALVLADVPLRRVARRDDVHAVRRVLLDGQELARADVLDDPAGAVAQLLEAPLQGHPRVSK